MNIQDSRSPELPQELPPELPPSPPRSGAQGKHLSVTETVTVTKSETEMYKTTWMRALGQTYYRPYTYYRNSNQHEPRNSTRFTSQMELQKEVPCPIVLEHNHVTWGFQRALAVPCDTQASCQRLRVHGHCHPLRGWRPGHCPAARSRTPTPSPVARCVEEPFTRKNGSEDGVAPSFDGSSPPKIRDVYRIVRPVLIIYSIYTKKHT